MINEANDRPIAVVVEDNTELAHLFSEALNRAGYRTEIIDRGDLVLSRLKQVQPDVVVLDLNLPFLSGRDILYQIRADETLAKTWVIIASANHHVAEQLRSIADLVLIKPVGFKQLRDLAARLSSRISM